MNVTEITVEQACDVLGVEVYDLAAWFRRAAKEEFEMIADRIHRGYPIDEDKIERARNLMKVATAGEAVLLREMDEEEAESGE
jgi:hypothetical protein